MSAPDAARGLRRLNSASPAEAEAALLTCCGSRVWARSVATARPFPDRAALFAAADEAWRALAPEHQRSAFAAHPRIGERAGEHAGAQAARWSSHEQRAVTNADHETRARIAEGNRLYEQRFGHIFLICAEGSSATQILAELEKRLRNEPDEELRVAAEEQRRITHLRLDRLIGT